MVADMLETNAWSVRLLGTNLPDEAIIQSVREHDADVLGISVTMLSSVPQVVDLVNKVRLKCGPLRPRILVGGAAFRFAPEFWREIEVEGSAEDLRSVLSLFDREQKLRQSG